MELNMENFGFYPPERRRHHRTRLQMVLQAVRLDPESGDVQDQLAMTDISRSGMGAMSDKPFYPGSRLVLWLPMHSDGRRRSVYGTVVRCNKAREGFSIGLEFDHAIFGNAMTAPAASVAAAA
jgi:hypothetical protein